MYKQCKTDESLERQQKMEQCLMELMQAQHYEEITISGLCKYAGIPRNTFYRYFSTKDDVLLALIDHHLEALNTHSMANWSGCSHLEPAQLCSYFTFWIQHRAFLDALAKNNRIWMLLERSFFLLDQTHPAFADDSAQRDQMRYLVTSSTTSVLLYWHQQGFPHSAEELAQITYELFASSNIRMGDMFL